MTSLTLKAGKGMNTHLHDIKKVIILKLSDFLSLSRHLLGHVHHHYLSIVLIVDSHLSDYLSICTNANSSKTTNVTAPKIILSTKNSPGHNTIYFLKRSFE